jgi:ADP-heptose:LPS heptosyltransferase
VLVDREGLGDVMLKTPFLRAVRRAYPRNPVWWIATHQSSMEDELRPMFEKDVTKVITQAGLNEPIDEVWKRLKALPPFEKVFDSRTKMSTVALARFGLTHRGFYCCLPGYFLCDGAPLIGRSRPRHIAERMLSLIPCATGKPADASGRLEASPQSTELAERLLPSGPTYLGIAPGSREARKNWPMERFFEAARGLVAKGLTPVFLLGPMEASIGAEIETAVPAAIVLQADPPETTSRAEGLDRLIAQGQRFAALLANDNGVGHLLGASGVPVVSLFGPTDPARWAPVAPANGIVRAQDFGASDEMAAIPVQPVIEAVLAMLEETKTPVGANQAPPARKS